MNKVYQFSRMLFGPALLVAGLFVLPHSIETVRTPALLSPIILPDADQPEVDPEPEEGDVPMDERYYT
ncbi:MAG: hypothetical protein KDB07_10475 [Planctomycetes bacterium]|nr:hypothetical protein [Planctomycetota bacterium]